MSNVDFDIDNFWPYNFCITEVQCALGIKLLARLDEMNKKRNVRARKIIRALKDYPELSFQKVPQGYYHCYHLLSAMYDGSKSSKTNHDFIALMAFTYGIKMIVQYYPLYRYPMFIKAGFGKARCPHTDRFFDQMVSFPFHHWMREKEIDYMIECTRKTLDQLRG
jgi:dTDP-4-amino-4,6-dideoxygalactose transaminase